MRVEIYIKIPIEIHIQIKKLIKLIVQMVCLSANICITMNHRAVMQIPINMMQIVHGDY